MRPLLIVSTAFGYGGAERSVELLAAHLQPRHRLVVMAQNPFHLDALRAILRPPSRLIAVRGEWGRWAHRKNSAVLAAVCLRHLPWAVVANTETAAQLLATAAPWSPGLAGRAFLYMRDFKWKNLPFIFSRLPSARVLIPGPAILEREDYLAPHLHPRGPVPWTVVPDMVAIPGRPSGGGLGEGVLHLAAVNGFKGHVHLIGAAAVLRREGRPIRVVSRGYAASEGLRDHLVRMAAESGLGDSFELGPHIPDPGPLLERCRCVVVTSVSHSGGPETFGRTVIEAWAHRKPVVGFAAGGVKHLIEDGKDGLLVPEGDERALARALDRLRNDDLLCRRLGEAGHARARRQFEAGRVADSFISFLRRSPG